MSVVKFYIIMILHGKYWSSRNGNKIYKGVNGWTQTVTREDFGYVE